MWIYWLMFLMPVCGSFYIPQRKDNAGNLILSAICVLFIFFIGLRFEVGGDWESYLTHYENIAQFQYSFFENASEWDAGYVFFEYLSAILGAGITGVNLACGTVIMTGLYYFCRQQPQPFLALTVAVPYMIFIIGMGYSRQSVALGFELLALIALIDGRTKHFLLWIVCAVLFHKSAILLCALGVLSLKDKSIGTVLVTLIFSTLIGWKVLNEHTESLWTNYVEAQMESEGGLIRVIMNAVPSILFLVFAKRLVPNDKERRVWFWIAIFSLVCIPLVYLASTAVDRVALYFIPIQLLVYSRIVYVFYSSSFRLLSTIVIIVGYSVILFVLLNYGTIIKIAWIPYKNIIF